MKKFLFILTFMVALVGTPAVHAQDAEAYLHVANAQNYARAHMWKTLCNYGNSCSYYPAATGWYQRINDNYVRVEVRSYVYGRGTCYRVFAVRGNDGSEYITTDGSSPYYYCQ